MEKVIDFRKAAENLRKVAKDYSQIDESYFFCHITPGSDAFSSLIEPSPFKIAGSMLILMLSGSDTVVEVNLEEFVVKPNSLLLIFPGNVIRTIGPVPTDLDAYVLYFDPSFSNGVNINLSSVAIPSAVQKPRPIMQLTAEESELLGKYFLLIYNATSDDPHPQLTKSITASLTAAMLYQLVLFYHRRLPGVIAAESDIRTGSRRNDYVREFVRLVHVHYVRERSVAFYADKLFISPKYLSLLVKEATGRSAAEWIDVFVLTEAKNLLRFSGKNIQQVAYALNFPTQSSFGKYFKHLTGLSPSEYQKS